MDIGLYVFSFNRGQFLENCLRSINAYCPCAAVYIIDDKSSDPYTHRVLSNLDSTYTVLDVPESEDHELKTGGLYGNMNYAMAHARSLGTQIVLFIQDDMQLVRPIGEEDLSRVTSYFSCNENTIQCAQTFIRTLSIDSLKNKVDIDCSRSAYIVKEKFEGGKSNFAATGFFNVDRFHARFQKFEAGEGRNSEKAQALGLKKGVSIYPIMNWLPYPISFRGKNRQWLHKLVETLGGAGYHPIEPMSPSEITHLLRRDPWELPIMEQFLTCPTVNNRYWSTGGGEYNIIARGGIPNTILNLLKLLNKPFKSRRKGTSN